MSGLVPVEGDPFATSPPSAIEARPLPPPPGKNSFGEPFGRPVDYDPFMSAGEDAGRSFVSHLGPGVANLMGAPGDFLSLVDKGSHWGAKKLYNSLGAEYPAHDPKSDERARTILGVTLPTSGELRGQQDQMFGTPHVPSTQAGKYAAAISEQAPAAILAPGGPLAKTMFAVGSGSGGEAADQFTQGTPLHPYARIAGQVVGGLPAAAGAALRSSPERVVGQAMGAVSDADQAAAIQLMRDAQARRGQLTFAEAMQEATGGATGLGSMQRVIESTKRGHEQLAPRFAARPAWVRQAGMDFADTIAPPNPQPSLIGPQAQTAAQGGLDLMRRTINSAAEPHYRALPGQLIPDADYATISANPSYRAALAELRGSPELNGPISGLPDNDLSVHNEVVKQLDTMRAAAANPQNANRNNHLASLRGDARTAADDLAAQVSPDWRAARDLVRQGHQQYLDPLEAGPTGQISRTDKVSEQTGILYPSSPLEGAPNETSQALDLMRAAEAEAAHQTGNPIATPGAGANLTRQHLVRALNEATADLQPGPNQYGGARYAKQIAGNPEQAATLRAGVESVAGPEAGTELDTLMRVLRATGKRQASGSMTAFSPEYLKDFGIAVPDPKAGLSLNPLTWVKRGETALRGAQQRRNTDALVRLLLSSPDEAERFLAGASRYAPNRPSALGRALQP